jgi:hypothetical protein
MIHLRSRFKTEFLFSNLMGRFASFIAAQTNKGTLPSSISSSLKSVAAKFPPMSNIHQLIGSPYIMSATIYDLWNQTKTITSSHLLTSQSERSRITSIEHNRLRHCLQYPQLRFHSNVCDQMHVLSLRPNARTNI